MTPHRRYQKQIILNHKFASTAAPPKRAAAPIAPVLMGAAAPRLGEVAPPVAAGAVEVGVGIPDVYGMPAVPVLAPLKAGGLLEAEGSGLAVVFIGLRTLEAKALVECSKSQ